MSDFLNPLVKKEKNDRTQSGNVQANSVSKTESNFKQHYTSSLKKII